MAEKIKKILKGQGVTLFLLALICILLLKMCSMQKGGNVPTVITPVDSTHTTIISNDKDFKELKKENKELYDSLKKYKNQIDHLIQFTHTKEYRVDTVYIHAEPQVVYIADNQGNLVEAKDSVYEYKGQDTDTLKYNLKVGSKVEPSWYALNVKVSEKFTIVNKELGNGVNQTDIQTGTNGEITDVTVYEKKDKTRFWDKFAVGPQVGAGYDVINNKLGVQVGIGVTYNLLPKKKK